MLNLIPATFEHFTVRFLCPKDAEAYVAIERNPNVRRYVDGTASKSDEQIRADVIRYQPTTEVMAIADASTDEYIGRCGLLPEHASNESEVYCLLAPNYWRRGIAVIVVPFLVRLAKSGGRAPIGIVDAGNRASQALLAHLGYSSSGSITSRGYQNGHLKYLL